MGAGPVTDDRLSTFIRACIAEDEIIATMRQWHSVECGWVPDAAGYTYPCDCGVPERLRAECESKRETLQFIESEFGPETRGYSWDFLEVARALAAVYADRPGYQPEWAR